MWYLDYQAVQQHCREQRELAAARRLVRTRRRTDFAIQSRPGGSPSAMVREARALWLRQVAGRLGSRRLTRPSQLLGSLRRPSRLRP